MEATGYDHKDNATGYTFYGMATLANKDRVPYSRIKGSPFLKDDWQLATLYAGTLKLSLCLSGSIWLQMKFIF